MPPLRAIVPTTLCRHVRVDGSGAEIVTQGPPAPASLALSSEHEHELDAAPGNESEDCSVDFKVLRGP